MLTVLSGFSQKDTTRVNDSTVRIPVRTARLLAKDVILKDYYQSLYTVYFQKDSLNQLRIVNKDNTISKFEQLDSTNTFMLNTYQHQQQVDKTTINTLNKDLKLEKWKTWGGVVIGIAAGLLIGTHVK